MLLKLVLSTAGAEGGIGTAGVASAASAAHNDRQRQTERQDRQRHIATHQQPLEHRARGVLICDGVRPYDGLLALRVVRVTRIHGKA